MSSSAPPAVAAATHGGHFECGQCHRAYSRVEHLSRHVRSHTSEKPYKCSTCDKHFSRSDLLKRHASVHDNEVIDDNGHRIKRPRARVSGRVKNACDACIRLHIRCDESKPCQRCRDRNLSCERAGSTVTSQDAAQEQSQLPDEATATSEHQPPIQPASGHRNNVKFAFDAPTNALGLVPGHDIASHSAESRHVYDPVQTTDEVVPAITEDASTPDFSFTPLHLSRCATPFPAFPLGSELDFELNNADFDIFTNFGDTLDIFNAPQISEHWHQTVSPDRALADEERTKAFSNSLWRYEPAPLQSSADEEAHLSLGGTDAHVAQRVQVPHQHAVQLPSLTHAERDRILAFILSTCTSASLFRTSGRFPSLELLNKLLQYFIAAPSSRARVWLHTPTILSRLDALPVELIVILIAAGAVLAPDLALQKLGFALQELVRLGLPRRWEADNAGIRDLHLLQTYFLQLEIALWSGNSRKTEIAESFTQPLITMLRRGGRFKDSSPETGASFDDSLSDRWLQWTEQESFKRLAFELFRLNIHSSIALAAPPLITPSELRLSLPSDEQAWSASSAETWEHHTQNGLSTGAMSLSLLDVAERLEIMSPSLPNSIDKHVAHEAFLCATWAFIHQRDLSRLRLNLQLNTQSDASNIANLLKRFDMLCLQVPLQRTVLNSLTLHSLAMHLHAPFDAILQCAGTEGPRMAEKSLMSIQSWRQTAPAREAIWHAGQVIRLAQSAPPECLYGYMAVALYHAGLTLWAFGAAQSHAPLNSTSSFNKPSLLLNRTEEISLQRFVALNDCAPRLQGVDGDIIDIMTDPAAVMALIVRVLAANFSRRAGPAPPLVERLISLLRNLHAASSPNDHPGAG